MDTSDLSFTAAAKRMVIVTFEVPRAVSIILSETISRIVAIILMSPAGACDLVMHSVFVIPTCIYACGKSIIMKKADFTIPGRHLNHVSDALVMTVLGSLTSLIHPILDYSSLQDRMTILNVN